MAGYSTTIESRMEVSGIDELKRAVTAIKELNGAAKALGSNKFSAMAGGFAQVESGAKKATNSYKGLASAAKAAGEASKLGASAGTYNKQVSEINKVTEAYKKQEAAAKQAAEAQKASAARAQTYAQQIQKYNQQQSQQRMQGAVTSTGGPNYSATGQKLGSTIKEATAAFSVGMLGAAGIMSAISGIKSMFTGGFEMLKSQQSGQAMWATSIQDAHNNIRGAALDRQAQAASDATMKTAILAGNSYEEANGFAKQIYSSDAGEYSGNVNKTQGLLKGVFNIQDANALNQREMEMLKTSIGNVGDLGKMNGQIAKSLNLVDGKITRAIRKQYKKETGHELGLNATGTGYDWGSVSAQTAYRGIDMYGNSGGIAKASERFNSTLPGMLRSGKFAAQYAVSNFMTEFGKQMAKGGEFGDIIGSLSKVFTNFDLLKAKSEQFANSLLGVANGFGRVIKAVAPYAKEFGSQAWSGLTGGFKIIKSIFNAAKDMASGFAKMTGLGNGAGVMKDVVGYVGKFIGMATALGLAMKTLKGGAGLLTDSAKALGSLFSVKGRQKPDAVFASATNRFSAAVSQFAGKTAVDGSGAGMVGGTGSNAKQKFGTRAERLAAGSRSIFARAFTKGKSMTRATGETELGRIYPGGFIKDSAGKFHRANGQYASESEIAKLTAMPTRMDRLANNGQPGFFKRNAGKALTKFGEVGMKVSASKVGGAVSALGKFGKVLGRGMPVINGAFAALDVANAMTSTKKGTVERHKAVGSAIGGGIGAVAGGALGSFLGPLGTVAGSMAGGWAGNKIGEIFGGMTGGKSQADIDKKKQSQAQKQALKFAKAQNAVENTLAKEDFADQMKTYGYDKKNSNELFKQIQKGQASGNKKKMLTAARMQRALEDGDSDAILKYQAQLNRQNGIKKGEEDAHSHRTKASSKPKSNKPSYGPQQTKAKKNSDANSPFAAIRNKAKSNGKDTGSKIGNSAKKATKDVNKLNQANKKVKGPKADGMAKYARESQKASKKANDAVAKAEKKISKAKMAPKSAKKDFNKLNRDAKSGVNKTAKTVKKGSKDVQKSAKNMFKFKSSKSPFNKLNSQAKSGINKVNRTVKSGAKKVQKSGKNMFKFKSSKAGFNKLTSTAKSGMNKVTRTVKSGSKKVQNSGKNIFKFKNSKSGFNQLVSTAKSGMNRVNTAVKSGAKRIQNSVKVAFRFKGAAAGFNQLNSQARSGMNKVDSTIKSAANKWTATIKAGLAKAAATMTSQFNKMSSTASSASSKISSSLSKIGTAASNAASKVSSLQTAIASLKSKTITLTVNTAGKGASKLATGTPGAKAAFASLPRYAKGTTNGGHTGGMALVNDAKGSNWREAFMLPNGLTGIFPNKRNIVMPLPAGTQVLNGDDTKKMFPHYAKGTDGSKKVFGGKADRAINITVNINGSASASDANTIANTIGEKLMTIMRPQVI